MSTDAEGVYVSEVAYGGIFTGNIGNTGTISSDEVGINVEYIGWFRALPGPSAMAARSASTADSGMYVYSVAKQGRGGVFRQHPE